MSRIDIPTPEELKATFEADIAPRVDAAVKRIVAEMRRASNSIMGKLWIRLQRGEAELEVELRAAFSGRGWDVQFQHNEWYGPHITLRPSPQDVR